jgi:hypothetical protein
MPDYLSDPAMSTFVIVGFMVFVLLLLAVMRKKKIDFVLLALGVLALIGLLAIDRLYDSPREATIKCIQQLSEASKKKDYNAMFDNISDQFQSANGDKKKFRGLVDQYGPTFASDGIVAWDYTRKAFSQDGNVVKQGFKVQVAGNPAMIRYCIGEFVEENGRWKLRSFKLYNPVQQDNGLEEPIPGL